MNPERGFFILGISIEQNIIDTIKLIPYGRVTTYGAIAAFVGAKSSARIVGYVLNKCSAKYNLPAHRVVNRRGLLSGKLYFGAGDEMSNLLKSEGIQVENDIVQNFDAVFWDPSQTINFL